MSLPKSKIQQQEAELEALVPHAMKWSDAQVVKFIRDIGFPQYELCFRDNFITGRKLILLDMSTLPKIGITDFKHMKTICHAIEDVLGVTASTSDRSIRNPRCDTMCLYLEAKTKTGERADSLKYAKFVQKYADQLRT